ncbi:MULTISPECIES: hypothetical protein [Idiomarina]|jgi:hypothetical protein|nr:MULTISPECIES: hypothetical protein [Idiomarina]KXS36395.1 MAG: putative conserved secreted protein [Idiomarina sp. T82-3]MEC8925486.1 hypothetical protein [Pseudomonadota bacterium]|tara:strand:- start:4494 stop:4997 length:504 start_codon:yes stop_codon:yes gene_type:complete
MMKRIIALTGILAASVALTAHAEDRNYVSGGYNDFGDSDFYIKASRQIDSHWVIEGEAFDIGDFGTRLGGQYLLSNSPLFLKGGMSHYDFGNTDDTGGYVGIGTEIGLSTQATAMFDATYDSALDGYASVGAKVRYNFDQRFAADIGFRGNFDDIDNEFRVGITYKF